MEENITPVTVRLRFDTDYGLHMQEALESYPHYDFYDVGVPQHVVDLICFATVAAHAAGMTPEGMHKVVDKSLEYMEEVDKDFYVDEYEVEETEGEAGTE